MKRRSTSGKRRRPPAVALAVWTYPCSWWPQPAHNMACLARALVLLVSGLLPQGCGDEQQEVRLLAREYRFEPAAISRLAGRPLTLVLTNGGREAHEFTSLLLRDPRVEVIAGPEAVRQRKADSLRLLPGRTARVTVKAPPGTYPFHCRIRGHGGMQGLITLE